MFLLVILSCKKHDKKPNDTTDSKKLEGKIILPQGSPINPANLTVLSTIEETTVNNGIYKMDSSSFKSYSTQFVLNSTGEPLMMRYNYPNNPDNDISAKSTALSMLMNTPAMQSLTEPARINLINNITKTIEFSALVDEISKNLIAGKGFIDSTNVSLMTSFKNSGTAILMTSSKKLGTANLMTSSKKLGIATSSLSTYGVPDEPILIHQAGKQVAFTNNGVAVNYWVGIYKNGQRIISVPISAANIFASSYTDLAAGVTDIVGDPASIDYTLQGDGQYTVYIRSGRISDNTFESSAARTQNLTLGVLNLIKIALPSTSKCAQAFVDNIKTFIETNLNLYTISVNSPSDLQAIFVEILRKTYATYSFTDCIDFQKSVTPMKKVLKIFTDYFDVVTKVGGILNVNAFVYHFFFAKPAIDACFNVSNGIVTSCGSIPTLTTTSVSSITSSTASSGGNISNDGGASIAARGICWSTSHNPTISDSKTSNGTGIGNFASSITGLTVNTTYYVRAYATNSAGTAYGNEVSFTTKADSISSIYGTYKGLATWTNYDGTGQDPQVDLILYIDSVSKNNNIYGSMRIDPNRGGGYGPGSSGGIVTGNISGSNISFGWSIPANAPFKYNGTFSSDKKTIQGTGGAGNYYAPLNPNGPFKVVKVP